MRPLGRRRVHLGRYVRQVLGRSGGISRLVRNALIDLRFGGRFLGGVVETRREELGYFKSENTDYRFAEAMFRHVPLLRDDVVVDVGCGNGRIINWLLSRGYANRIVGVEVDAELAASTRERLRAYPQVEVRASDIFDAFPDEGTVFYLYNPFERRHVVRFAQMVVAATAGRPQRMPGRPVVLYYNPVYLDVFEQSPAWKVVMLSPMPAGASRAALLIQR